MKKHVNYFFAFAGMLLLSLVSFSSTSAQGAVVDRYPITIQGTIDCSGEYVVAHGFFQSTTNVLADGNGGYHVTDNWNFKAKGFGDQGNEYVINGQDNFGRNFKAGETYINVGITNAVGKGNAANLKTTFLRKYTVNANGVLTVYIDDFKFTCK